jgi:hypothetical protein
MGRRTNAQIEADRELANNKQGPANYQNNSAFTYGKIGEAARARAKAANVKKQQAAMKKRTAAARRLKADK